METRDVTARLRITLEDAKINVKSLNIYSIYEELTILSKAIAMMGSNKYDELDSYDYKYFDGEDPSICLAFNIETHELQVSVNDIGDTLVLGILEYAKQVVIKDLMGE